jgi:hypothetical protein
MIATTRAFRAERALLVQQRKHVFGPGPAFLKPTSMLGTLNTWLHNGTRQVLSVSRHSSLRLSPIRAASVTQRCLNTSIRNNTTGSGPLLSKTSDNGSGRTTSRTLWLLASITSGIAGYAIATYSASILAADSANDAREPQFGTPADFKNAIEELRLIFPSEDSVSTDSDDLYVHGFSEYDYHPGENSWIQQLLSLSCLCFPYVVQLPSLAW